MPAVTLERVLETPKVVIEFRNYDIQDSLRNSSHYADASLIELSLTPRMSSPYGRLSTSRHNSPVEQLGDFVFLPAGATLHGGCGPGQARSILCWLKRDVFDPLPEQLDVGGLTESLHISNRAARQNIERIFREVMRPTADAPAVVEALAYLAIVDLARHLARRSNDTSDSGSRSALLGVIEDRVNATLAMPSLADIAAACRLSTRHVNRAFQEQADQSLGAYVRSVAVARARHMLVTSDMPVKKIANLLGYGSSASFSHAFTQAAGMTPTAARQMTGGDLPRKDEAEVMRELREIWYPSRQRTGSELC